MPFLIPKISVFGSQNPGILELTKYGPRSCDFGIPRLNP